MPPPQASLKKSNGFTLIEMMIVVAIIGILSALAYPSYMSQLIKSRRTDAQRIMISHALTMERYFTGNNSYTANNACGPLDPLASPFYTYANVCTAMTFIITATAIGTQAVDGILTLDNTGSRTPVADEKWKN